MGRAGLGRGAVRRVVLRFLRDGLALERVDATLCGRAVTLHLDNACEAKTLLAPHVYDREERRFIARMFPPDGGVFVDVGANAGLLSFHAACRARSGCRVVVIEPNPVMMARARTCVLRPESFDTDAVAFVFAEVAIADREGEAEFVVTADPGESHLAAAGATGTIRTPLTTLPALLARHGLERIDILKLDVEGFEEAALGPLLAHGPLPEAIILEDCNRALWRSDLSATLERVGYRRVARSRTNVMLVR